MTRAKLARALARSAKAVERIAERVTRLGLDLGAARTALEGIDAVIESPVLTKLGAQIEAVGKYIEERGAWARAEVDALVVVSGAIDSDEIAGLVQARGDGMERLAEAIGDLSNDADGHLDGFESALDELNEAVKSRRIARLSGQIHALVKEASKLADATTKEHERLEALAATLTDDGEADADASTDEAPG